MRVPVPLIGEAHSQRVRFKQGSVYEMDPDQLGPSASYCSSVLYAATYPFGRF